MTQIIPGGTTHGVYPWNISRTPLRQSDVSDDIYYGCDNSTRISACLNCKLKECINCYGKSASPRKTKYVRRTARKENECKIRELFKQLYDQRLTSKQIQNQLNISKSTYIRYKKRYIGEGDTAYESN